jgi:neutral ceramidase
MKNRLHAGASVEEITPSKPHFLYGYPFVRRYSTGVNDPLLSTALFLSDGETPVLLIGNDVIWVGKETVRRVRERIAAKTSIPARNIMVTATHTHSGPMTVDYISNEGDEAVPKTDPAYLSFMEDRIVTAAVKAYEAAEPAELGQAVTLASGIGTNRRDPGGPADSEVPVMLVRSLDGNRPTACMLVCSMHPTVLHEDSRVTSGDFPGLARRYLQRRVLGVDCPVLYHTGPSGNQSPRHVTRANTLEEAERLAALLGKAVGRVVPDIELRSALKLDCLRTFTDLPRRAFPSVAEARLDRDRARARLESLKTAGAQRQAVRTAEVDWFGAEETLTLAQAAAEGRLEQVYSSVLPAEIQVIWVGPWTFVSWPGEVFVEYSLDIKRMVPNTFVVSLANGELQGYVVTPEAVAEGAYEAANALFTPESGTILVRKTMELLASRLP